MYKPSKDDKYVSMFLEEVLELIEMLERNTSKLDDNYQLDTLNETIKTLRDIKCISAAMGLNSMCEISCNVESFLSRVVISKIRIDDRVIKMLMDSIGEFKSIYFCLSIDYRYNPVVFFNDFKTGSIFPKN